MKGKHRSSRSADASGGSSSGGNGRSGGNGPGARNGGERKRGDSRGAPFARPQNRPHTDNRPADSRPSASRPPVDNRGADNRRGDNRASPSHDQRGQERGHDQRPHSERGGSKRIWLYGIHPVLAALANPRRRAFRILLTQDAEDTLGARLNVLAEEHPLGFPKPEILAREIIDRNVPRGAVHQGVAAQVEGLDDTDIEDICRATEGQEHARIVVLDQVTDPHNVGAVIRSAAAFSAAAVILPERHSPGDGGVLAKSASGAVERVPLVRVVNLARALDRLKQAGFWCVGLAGEATTAIHEADLTGKIALVLGAEGEGLRRLTREHCDLMVRIPIHGGIDSLNVSNAAAISLYELARRG